jgi:transposase
MAKKYVLKLTAQEREELERVTQGGMAAVRKVQKARALLLCDQGEAGPAWKDVDIAQAVGTTVRSLESWRRRACEVGPLEALQPRWSGGRKPKLDGRGEARVVQLACSQAPEGHERWTLRLLADRLVELEVVEAVSYETVRQTLKKTISSRG